MSGLSVLINILLTSIDIYRNQMIPKVYGWEKAYIVFTINHNSMTSYDSDTKADIGSASLMLSES